MILVSDNNDSTKLWWNEDSNNLLLEEKFLNVKNMGTGDHSSLNDG